MLYGHGICCMDMVYAVWTWDMLYGHGTCLLVGEEYVLLEKNRCLLVGEE